MTSTRSALDADWLGVCRRAVGGLDQVLSAVPTTAERAVETGERGRGGDRTLEIDRGAESVVLAELDRLRDEGYRFAALSEERGEVDYGDPSVKVIIDPIDGSLNAKRRIPHYALSIAVAAGDTMADVVFAFVYDFGPQEEWWARRGEGAMLNGELLDPTSRNDGAGRAARGARDRVGRSALGQGVDRRARVDQLPAARVRDDRLDALPGRRRPVRRDAVAAAGARRRLGRRPADRARGGGVRQLPALRRTPGRTARRRPHVSRGRRPLARDARDRLEEIAP